MQGVLRHFLNTWVLVLVLKLLAWIRGPLFHIFIRARTFLYLLPLGASTTTNTSITMDESQSTLAKSTEKPYVSNHNGIAVRLAVGGMTCVACSRAITDALSNLEGVSDISVNQVGKSASVVVTSADLVESIATLIEDIGYECKVISVTPIVAAGTSGRRRTVALEFKDMETLSVPSLVL